MVVDRPQLDQGFKDPEAALDLHQLAVRGDDVVGTQLRMVGLQHEDAVVAALLPLGEPKVEPTIFDLTLDAARSYGPSE